MAEKAKVKLSKQAPKTNKRRHSFDVISDLESKRNSKIITYVVSTKQGVNFQIADDAVRVIFDHLNNLRIKKDQKIDLFLHSFGGVGIVPWKLVNLIREFCSEFNVLVPYKAYSAATLIALGANKIVMHPMGELGPVDPKVGNEFNPITPQGQPLGINVEDVASYVSFIKDFVGIRHEDELIKAINAMTDKVHPLALGNVHRFYSQSRMMAGKLLKLHMTDQKEEHIIEEISETLTSKLFFHGHPINRREASELKLKIEEPDAMVEKLMWELYLFYEGELEIRDPFIPQEILNQSGQNTINSKLVGATVESFSRRDDFVQELKITRPTLPPNQSMPLPIQIQAQYDAIVIPLSSGWQKVR